MCASLAFIGAAIEPAAQGRPTTATFAKKDAVALGISYDINWRGRLDPPMHPSSIGCAISFGILEHSMSRGSQEFWEMAVLASKQMKSSLSGGSKSSKSALYACRSSFIFFFFLVCCLHFFVYNLRTIEL